MAVSTVMSEQWIPLPFFGSYIPPTFSSVVSPEPQRGQRISTGNICTMSSLRQQMYHLHLFIYGLVILETIMEASLRNLGLNDSPCICLCLCLPPSLSFSLLSFSLSLSSSSLTTQKFHCCLSLRLPIQTAFELLSQVSIFMEMETPPN